MHVIMILLMLQFTIQCCCLGDKKLIWTVKSPPPTIAKIWFWRTWINLYYNPKNAKIKVCCANPNLGEVEGIGGGGWYHWKEHWWVPIGPHSNFSPICMRFRDIAAFVLQHTMLHFTVHHNGIWSVYQSLLRPLTSCKAELPDNISKSSKITSFVLHHIMKV